MTTDVLTSQAPSAPEQSRRRMTIGFMNWAHAIDHFVILIYPTVVIELQTAYGESYSELIALATASFVAFGLFSLPAGWLGDRWSRRDIMFVFYIGCGLSLIGAVVAEIAAGSAGAGSGLAYKIAESGYRLNIPRMFAALLLLSAAGIVIYGLLALASHLILRRWHESALGEEN